MVLIAFAILVIAVYLFINFKKVNKNTANSTSDDQVEITAVVSDCCGAHEICEFNEADFNEEIITYFNDEELDVLRNVRESDFTSEQIDSLREVLYTLQPNEISKWQVSLSRRHIHLPDILKQEARQLAVEQ
jgi:hypothetical protein